jgi:mevalonate kinase
MAWERVFHGNPSGVDAAIAAMGGAIVFERKGEKPDIEPLEFGTQLVLAIGHSGASSSTKSMVDSVARQRDRNPDLVRKTFEGITAISRNARLAIEAGDVVALGKLLDMNQMLLAGLLLSTQEIETLCVRAREAGALGSKLTGAGGGGCVVALAESHEAAEEIVDAWTKDGFSGFVTEAGNREVRVKRARAVEGAA